MSRRDPIRRRQPLPALISGVRYHYAVHATRENTIGVGEYDLVCLPSHNDIKPEYFKK